MSETEYDIIIFGATGFVGKIMTRYMAQHVNNGLRWAIAGRSKAKLEKLQTHTSELNSENRPDIFIADAKDDAQLKKLCERTRVIVSTVGPFALFGEPLIKACVEVGTDYCDITGEPHWILQMISRYQQQALQSGARIVNCCGFDSIPSDLGVYFTQKHAEEKFTVPCNQINMRVTQLKGAFSGGTYASLINAIKEISKTPALRQAMSTPYALCPSNHTFSTQQTQHRYAAYDELTESWLAPFVMEGINTKIVHRSNALLGNRYGSEFKYDEAILTGTGRRGRKRASRMAIASGALIVAAAISPLRWLLERFFIPKPGEGPSQQQQDEGKYCLSFVGRLPGNKRINCTVSGDKDPGYGSTAKMLAQAATCLALDIPKQEPAGGFWTPATIFGDKLIDRLQAHAGISFDIKDA